MTPAGRGRTSKSDLTPSSRRAYRDLSGLPEVVASDVECDVENLLIRLEFARGVERVPPSVLRVAADHDLGVGDFDRDENLGVLVELVANIGVDA